MATTNTVTSPYAGQTVYSFTALATNDTFDIDVSQATEILWQVTGGTIGTSTVALVGSLDGSTWVPLYQKPNGFGINWGALGVSNEPVRVTALPSPGVFYVQPTRFVRVQVTGAGGSGIQCTLIVRTL